MSWEEEKAPGSWQIEPQDSNLFSLSGVLPQRASVPDFSIQHSDVTL